MRGHASNPILVSLQAWLTGIMFSLDELCDASTPISCHMFCWTATANVFSLWGLVRLILREKDWEKIISHYNIYEINYFQIPFNSLEEGINWTRLEWGNSFVESYIPIISIILFAKVLGKKVTFLNWLQHIKKNVTLCLPSYDPVDEWWCPPADRTFLTQITLKSKSC